MFFLTKGIVNSVLTKQFFLSELIVNRILIVSMLSKTRSPKTTAKLTGAPNENIVQNHLHIALLSVF